jgi:pyruvate formate lyase activating enzyme
VKLALLKTSLIDYPGRVASVAFLPGCNLRCPYCHNPELALGTGLSELCDWKTALDHLRRRRGLVTGLVFSGGEPCLRPELPAMTAQAREAGVQVKLDTNGTMPDVLAAVGADYIALDLKTAFDRYGELAADPARPGGLGEAVLRSVAITRELGCEYEFRITCAPGIFGLAEAQALLPQLKPDDPVVLQAYRPGAVLNPAWAATAIPYTRDELESLLATLRRAAPSARLRGL